MKKSTVLAVGLCAVLFASCASNSLSNISTFPELKEGNFNSDRYIILGEVSGESVVSVKSTEIINEKKNLITGENAEIILIGDNKNYGFVGKDARTNLTVLERAQALAEYKLISLAEFNNADAVIGLKKKIEITEDKSYSVIKTTVSGYAVRIIPDKGYVIEFPPEPVVEETVTEVTEETAEQAEE